MKRMFQAFALVTVLALPSFAAQTPVETPWEVLSNDDGILVHRKEIPGSPVVAFKGEAVIEAPIAKVASVLYDTSRKMEWVAKLAEAKDVRMISNFERIEYNHTSTPVVLKDRDFVFHAKVDLDRANQRMRIALKSVEDAFMPDEGKYVRGELLNSAYTLTSLEGGTKTRLKVEIHADPKGSVAKWIVNLFQKSWPRKTLEGIRKQVAKADVKEHALVKAYFEGKDVPGAPAPVTIAE